MCAQKQVQRDSNIELLRIITMFGVIILHYNNPLMGGALTASEAIPANNAFVYLCEGMAVCAVNVFMVVCGYFSAFSLKARLPKLLALIIQVIVYRVARPAFNIIVGKAGFGPLAAALLPVNYFVILYCVTCLLSPYINLLMSRLSRNDIIRLTTIVCLAFLAWPEFVSIIEGFARREFSGLSTIGINGAQGGYTIVNFITMYIVGACIRRVWHRKIETRILVISFFVCAVLLALWGWVFRGFQGNGPEGGRLGAWAYCNPLVAAEAVIIFMFFRSANLGKIAIVNRAAKASFTVFLTHNYLIKYMRITAACSLPLPLFALHMLACCLVSYVFGWICWELWDFAVGRRIAVPLGKVKDLVVKDKDEKPDAS